MPLHHVYRCNNIENDLWTEQKHENKSRHLFMTAHDIAVHCRPISDYVG